jgi:hypothetical protein
MVTRAARVEASTMLGRVGRMPTANGNSATTIEVATTPASRPAGSRKPDAGVVFPLRPDRG